MRISAAICLYNQKYRLKEAVLSVLQQRHEVDELIVVDDGSTDGGASELETFPQVTLVRFAENRGLGAARNAAWRAARGDLIAFLDADGVMRPDYLERLAALFALPENEMVAGAGGQNWELCLANKYDRYRQLFMAQAPDRARCFVPGLGAVYRRAALAAVGGFDEGLRTNGEDLDIGLRLTGAGWRFLIAPDAGIEHYRCDTRTSFAAMVYRYHYFEGLVLARHNRPWFWNRWWVPLTTAVSTTVRAAVTYREPELIVPALVACLARWSAALNLTLAAS